MARLLVVAGQQLPSRHRGDTEPRAAVALLLLAAALKLPCVGADDGGSEIACAGDGQRAAETTAHPLGPGHLLPFGCGGPRLPIDSVQLFPAAAKFFERYAKLSRPLVMREAVKQTRAYDVWTDEYFLSFGGGDSDDNGDDRFTVLIETKKKESRTQPSIRMAFSKYVALYNSTDYYMVEPVPEFLQADVALPGPLQCQDILDSNLVENIMWFSSGGTKSVVHTDAADNIICLYSGEKDFVLVDPHLHGAAMSDLDHPEGAYSSVDVDRVDYDRYPGFANVEFRVTRLSAGDCLFIPYKWIHQVNSYGRNIAVNVWWDFHRNDEINLENCNTHFDANLTLHDTSFHGFSSLETSPAGIRSFVEDLIRFSRVPVDVLQLRKIGLGPLGDPEIAKKAGAAHNKYVLEIFSVLDRDGDGQLTTGDLELCTNEDWHIVLENFKYLNAIIKKILEPGAGSYEEQYGPRLPRDEL